MFVVTEVIPGRKDKRTMLQSEYDALFFDLVYGGVSVTEEKSMENGTFNHLWLLAENDLVS